MYRATPRRKALTVALVTPNKPNSRCAFVHGELAPPTRSESFGVDCSSAMVVFPITEVKRHGFISNDHATFTIAAPVRVATVVAISFGVSI